MWVHHHHKSVVVGSKRLGWVQRNKRVVTVAHARGGVFAKDGMWDCGTDVVSHRLLHGQVDQRAFAWAQAVPASHWVMS